MSKTFETNENLLKDLLARVHTGNIQLPEFQRNWVWDDEHIKDILASISLTFPIGALMFLEVQGASFRFKSRLLEGVVNNEVKEPEVLVLDGQQRLTSTYLVLKNKKPVETKQNNKKTKRFYYLDIAKCLDPEEDRFDAILSIEDNKLIKSDFGRKIEMDLTTREKEFDNGFYPINIIFDHNESFEWRRSYEKHFNYDREKLEIFSNFEREVLLCFNDYKLPVLKLNNKTPKEAVCKIFEKVNTGGVVLTVFELVTASFAADDFDLRSDWERIESEIKQYKQLRGIEGRDFLTALTLLSTYVKKTEESGAAVSCKKKDVLRLKLDDYEKYSDKLKRGFIKAAKLLTTLNVYDNANLPYQTQLIPLSAICAYLEDRFDLNTRQRLAKWYWSGVFGEMYGGANETRYAQDIVDVIDFVLSGDEPRTIRDANFSPLRLLTLQTRNSAAYKGLMALFIENGSVDFISGDSLKDSNFFDLSVDIHHIFPKKFSEERGYPIKKWNSIINKAPLTAKSNRSIGGRAPSEYLKTIEKQHNQDEGSLDARFHSHLINPELLRENRFDDFIIDRAKQILDLIHKAMGKPIYGRDSDDVISAFGDKLGESESVE